MKQLILIFAILLSLFACNKSEEVKPTTPTPPVVRAIQYFISDRYKYYASEDNGLVVMAKTKADYDKGIFILPPSFKATIGKNVYDLGNTRSVQTYYRIFPTELIIFIQDKNSLGNWFRTHEDSYFLIR